MPSGEHDRSPDSNDPKGENHRVAPIASDPSRALPSSSSPALNTRAGDAPELRHLPPKPASTAVSDTRQWVGVRIQRAGFIEMADLVSSAPSKEARRRGVEIRSRSGSSAWASYFRSSAISPRAALGPTRSVGRTLTWSSSTRGGSGQGGELRPRRSCQELELAGLRGVTRGLRVELVLPPEPPRDSPGPGPSTHSAPSSVARHCNDPLGMPAVVHVDPFRVHSRWQSRQIGAACVDWA